MPAARNLADVEAIVVGWLAGDAGVSALAADRVVTELDADFPAAGRADVQIFRATSTETDPATAHLERAVVQVNVYGSSKAGAWNLTAETWRALRALAGETVAGAVVTAVERVTGPTWSPDPSNDAPRYTGSAAVWLHPTG